MFLFGMTGLTMGVFVAFAYDGFHMRKLAYRYKPENYEFPAVSDFKITIIGAIITFFFKSLIETIFYYPLQIVCKEQKDEDLKEARCVRGAYNIF